MRHPSEFWIRYLLSSGRHSYEQIIDMLAMQGLGAAEVDYLEAVEADLLEDQPDPFRPKNKADRVTQKWLTRKGIYYGWHRDKHTKLALSVLENSTAKALVESFILSPVPPKLAVAKINDQLNGLSLTEQSFHRYRHFFWNNSLLNIAEMSDFIAVRDDPHQDWLRAALRAKGPDGMQLVMWKTGLGVLDNMDKVKIFADFRNIAYMKAKSMEFDKPGIDDSKAMLNYARVARTAQDEINNSDDASRDVLDSFQAFKMRRQSLKNPGMKELTGGNYTEPQNSIETDDQISY